MRAMIELAQRRDEGVLLPARQIAERQQIPVRFLEQQLGALSRAGLVESFRGAGGGCRIARDPAEIDGRRDRRRDRGADLPGVLPRALGPHVLRGLTLWAARVLGRRGPGGAAGVRRDDGGGPRGPPPDDVGVRARQPRTAGLTLERAGRYGATPPHRLRGVHAQDLRQLRAAHRARALQRRDDRSSGSRATPRTRASHGTSCSRPCRPSDSLPSPYVRAAPYGRLTHDGGGCGRRLQAPSGPLRGAGFAPAQRLCVRCSPAPIRRSRRERRPAEHRGPAVGGPGLRAAGGLPRAGDRRPTRRSTSAPTPTTRRSGPSRPTGSPGSAAGTR